MLEHLKNLNRDLQLDQIHSQEKIKICSMKIKDQFSKRERTEKGTNLTKVSRDGFPWGSRLDKSPNSLQSVQLFPIVYTPHCQIANRKHKRRQKRKTSIYFHRSSRKVNPSEILPQAKFHILLLLWILSHITFTNGLQTFLSLENIS